MSDTFLKVKAIDWTQFVQRKLSIFFASTYFSAERNLLKEVIGKGLTNQLWHNRGEIITYFNSITELEDLDQFILTHYLEHSNIGKLQSFVDKGHFFNRKIQEYISSWTTVSSEEIVNNLPALIEDVEYFWVYGVVIPYFFIKPINTIQESGQSIQRFQPILDLFQPLRAYSPQLELQDVVFKHIWKIASEKISYTQDYVDLRFLTSTEIKQLLQGNFLDISSIVQNRKHGCWFYYDQEMKQTYWNYNQDFDYLLKPVAAKTKQISGNIACKGMYTGKVRIVHDFSDAQHFEPGEIIVAFETKPSLMPYLRQCGAIVTDEGGIMSHAAIVSRELNKPCIIGTKIATQVLKNGDTVEVDAVAGVITILDSTHSFT
jgi:phosphohistidine swiveling domain-containing protein